MGKMGRGVILWAVVHDLRAARLLRRAESP